MFILSTHTVKYTIWLSRAMQMQKQDSNSIRCSACLKIWGRLNTEEVFSQIIVNKMES